MLFRKPHSIAEWLRLVLPAILITAAALIGLIAERAVPRGGMTGLSITLVAMVPAIVISIATGCWLLRISAQDEFGRTVKGAMLGLALLAANLLIAVPGFAFLRKFIL